jgi:hypothetical protein
MRVSQLLRAALVAALATAAVGAATAADPSKTLRVAFNAAETGFDPQAGGDAYSNHVNRVISTRLQADTVRSLQDRVNTAAAF